jgi:flagella basal body P-ring formation protein FlgA
MSTRQVRIAALAALLAGTGPLAAESLVATRTVRPGEVLSAVDIRLDPAPAPGALARSEDAVGLVARRLLVAGRPIMPGDIGPPPAVRRNGPVTLVFRRGGLSIKAEGRALADAAMGEPVRAINTSSRQTVTGTVSGEMEITFGETK